MRIRHILPQPALGILPPNPMTAPMTGGVGAAWHLALQQAAAGHDVEVFSPGTGSRNIAERIEGVNIFRLSLWKRCQLGSYDFSYLLPLELGIRRARSVDITHGHDNPYFLIRPKSSAAVLHYNSNPRNMSPRYGQALRKADAVICCSDFIRQRFLTSVSFNSAHTHVIRNGADTALFSQPDRMESRSAFGLADDQIAMVYAGRVVPEKGLLELIQALHLMSDQGGLNYVLLVAGSAGLGYVGHPQQVRSEFMTYEKTVRNEACSLSVRFLGNVPRDRLPVLFRAGDIFVCPSIYPDPFPLVNVEAAAAGLPIVGFAVGGLPEIVNPNVNGLLVPAGDVSALANVLLSLMQDRAKRERLGRRGQEISKQFDWKLLNRRVIEVYQSVLNQ